MELTENQEKLLGYIRSYRRTEGNSPTMREMAKAMGLTNTKTVQEMLDALEKKGFIERKRGRSRGVLPKGGTFIADGTTYPGLPEYKLI